MGGETFGAQNFKALFFNRRLATLIAQTVMLFSNFYAKA